MRAPLGQVCRREQDGDPTCVGPAQVAVDHGRTTTVASLGDGRVRAPDQRGPGKSVGEVDLDVDHVADRPLQGDGVGGRDHQPTPRTCSTSAAPRSASSTPTRSIRMPPARARRARGASARPAGAAARGLPRRDRLERVTERRRAARLHLAEDQHVTVAEHQVDLAEVAPPVAVDQHHPVVDQALRGDALAVGAEAVVVWAATHARPAHCVRPTLSSPSSTRLWRPGRKTGLWASNGHLIRRTGSPMTVASQVVTSCDRHRLPKPTLHAVPAAAEEV